MPVPPKLTPVRFSVSQSIARRIRGMLEVFFAIVVLLAVSPSYSWAQGTGCLPITASRSTLAEAQDFASSLPSYLHPEVRQSPNGFFAVTLNRQEFSQNGYSLSRLKEDGAIPRDAFCSSGKGFSEPLTKSLSPIEDDTAGTPRLTSVSALGAAADKVLPAAVIWFCAFVIICVLRFLFGKESPNKAFKSPAKDVEYPLIVKKILISEGQEIEAETEVAKFASAEAGAIHRPTVVLKSETAGVVSHLAVSRGETLKNRRVVYQLQGVKTPLAQLTMENMLTSMLASISILYVLSHPKWAAGITAGEFAFPNVTTAPLLTVLAGLVALLHVRRFGVPLSTLVACVPLIGMLAFFEQDPLTFSTPWGRYAEARKQEKARLVAYEQRLAEQVQAERQAELARLAQQLSETTQIAKEAEHKFVGRLKFACGDFADTFPGRFTWTIAKLEQGKERTENYVSCVRKQMRRDAPGFVKEHNRLAQKYSKLATRWWELSDSTMPPRILVPKISGDYIQGRIEQTIIQAKLDEYNKAYTAKIDLAKRNTREIEEEHRRRQNLALALAQWSAQNQRALDQQLSQMIYGVRPFSAPAYRPVTSGSGIPSTSSTAPVVTTSPTPKKRYRWASCDYADSFFPSALNCVMSDPRREPNTVILHRCAPDEKNCHRGVWGSVLTDMPDNLNEVLPPLGQDD